MKGRQGCERKAVKLRGCGREGDGKWGGREEKRREGGKRALRRAQEGTSPQQQISGNSKGEKRISKVSKNRAVSLHHKRQGNTDLDWVDQKHEIPEKNKRPSDLASRDGSKS